MKTKFFAATIVNILLWGYELLTLRAADLKKLEVFHHKGIQHVLIMSRLKQATERLTNCSLQKRLDGVATIQETIKERRLNWLGNVARQLDLNIPKKLLTAWTSRLRNNCGQKLTLRELNAMAINHKLEYNAIEAALSNECPSNSWVPLAKEYDQRRTLIYKCRNDRLVQLKKHADFLTQNASPEPSQADSSGLDHTAQEFPPTSYTSLPG
jgi:hypothetical protein